MKRRRARSAPIASYNPRRWLPCIVLLVVGVLILAQSGVLFNDIREESSISHAATPKLKIKKLPKLKSFPDSFRYYMDEAYTKPLPTEKPEDEKDINHNGVYFMTTEKSSNTVMYCQYLRQHHGIGNKLNQYWIARVYALLNHMHFRLIGCSADSFQISGKYFKRPCDCDIYDKSKYWSGYLPQNVSTEENERVRQRMHWTDMDILKGLINRFVQSPHIESAYSFTCVKCICTPKENWHLISPVM